MPNKPNNEEIIDGGNTVFDFDAYRIYVYGKYSKKHACDVFGYTKRYLECLSNPSLFNAIPSNLRHHVLVACVCASKFLGIYEQYKEKLKTHGIKWNNSDTAFNGFLAIFNHKHETLPQYVKEINPILHQNEKLFLKFLALTGLRPNEAVTSFNMILDLNNKGVISEYYNSELSVLEHFKYKVFLRGTKNAYISFVSKELVAEICGSEPISYNAIHCRLLGRKIKLRLKELRSYHNSYLRKNGIISELVDVLAGRVPKTVFARHYLGEDMKAFSSQVLRMQEKLVEILLTDIQISSEIIQKE